MIWRIQVEVPDDVTQEETHGMVERAVVELGGHVTYCGPAPAAEVFCAVCGLAPTRVFLGRPLCAECRLYAQVELSADDPPLEEAYPGVPAVTVARIRAMLGDVVEAHNESAQESRGD